MKTKLIILISLVCSLFFAKSVSAATINAVSCPYDDVNAAVSGGRDVAPIFPLL